MKILIHMSNMRFKRFKGYTIKKKLLEENKVRRGERSHRETKKKVESRLIIKK